MGSRDTARGEGQKIFLFLDSWCPEGRMSGNVPGAQEGQKQGITQPGPPNPPHCLFWLKTQNIVFLFVFLS
jgi:hypothetical protein